MKRLIVLLALVAAGCGSATTSTAPSPVPTPTPAPAPTPPPVVAKIQTLPCPTVITGVDIGFYKQIACNGFEAPTALQPLRKWTVAPSVYLKTIDEAGALIDAVTLDTVEAALIAAAPSWTGGKFSITVTRGTSTKENQSGWVTVKWLATTQAFCGRADVAIDGGTIELSPQTQNCGCPGGPSIRPETARHEVGHMLGFWHTDSATDVMSNLSGTTKACDQQPSARELAAAAAHYR